METTLANLEHRLKENRADYFRCLQPPLTINEICHLEEKYQVKLPGDLKALYQWKNGQKNDCYKAFVNNSMFIPLGEVLDIAAELTSMIGFDFDVENWWNEQWIPVFHNGGGDYICYDTGGVFTGRKGQLIEFWHADNNRNVIAPSLTVFLSQLNNYYQSVPNGKFDEYISPETIDGYPKIFMVE
ncbi:SMI1/KNR4 family protein [Sinomicrobium pectinilyticum]|uniref:Benzoate transporter n=1 Tax=Sinomicrobium pectinilyticum TaxID=1084421 RepID=A0A3N0DQT7_SINP1|nr:SMI1/KNR4 family protein [Sinomicrobium pectinilyticum]RNL77997.1 benzoate transporter [Sinomicrobium pectinilyticum]